MCLHPKLEKTGNIITGRFEKRDIDSDVIGAPYYCDGEEAICECGAMFIIPSYRELRIVEIEKEPAKIKN